jgi:CRP/FNR family transcriptional regulator
LPVLQTILTALAKVPLFRGLDDRQLNELASLMRRRVLARGEILWRQGDPADGLYVVATGMLKVMRTNADGNEVVLHLRVACDTEGEPGIFSKEHDRRTECSALQPTECLFADRRRLFEFYERHPAALFPLAERLSAMVRDHVTQLGEVAFRDITTRLAWKLFDLATTYGEPVGGGGVRITLALPQGVLAAMVAASRPNVNRALGKLATEGLIRSERGRVTVLDLELLRRRIAIGD